jgi:hypothetical protein
MKIAHELTESWEIEDYIRINRLRMPARPGHVKGKLLTIRPEGEYHENRKINSRTGTDSAGY